MQNDFRNIIRSFFFETALLIILMLLVPLFIWLDLAYFENNLSELSIVEISQAIFILLSSLICLRFALNNKDSKGFFLLLASLFGAMFIREEDALLDYIFPGAWKLFVIVLLIISIYFIYPERDSIKSGFRMRAISRPFTYILIGLLIVLLFSRTFGTGSLWEAALGENYFRPIKTVVQEGTELLGYVIIFMGSVLLHRSDQKN